MFTQPTQKRANRLAAAAMVLTLGGGFATLAFAKIVANTIDLVAVAADNGRLVVVTGPITCTARERAYVRVTVTQRTTGAVAEGSGFVTCTGAGQQWEVHAETQGRASFAPVAALAVGLATTSLRGATTDAHQWLVNVTLVEE